MNENCFVDEKQLSKFLKKQTENAIFEGGVVKKFEDIIYGFSKILIIESRTFCNRNKRKKIKISDVESAIVKILDKSCLGRL